MNEFGRKRLFADLSIVKRLGGFLLKAIVKNPGQPRHNLFSSYYKVCRNLIHSSFIIAERSFAVAERSFAAAE